jgi:hypothetical protein
MRCLDFRLDTFSRYALNVQIVAAHDLNHFVGVP